MNRLKKIWDKRIPVLRLYVVSVALLFSVGFFSLRGWFTQSSRERLADTSGLEKPSDQNIPLMSIPISKQFANRNVDSSKSPFLTDSVQEETAKKVGALPAVADALRNKESQKSGLNTKGTAFSPPSLAHLQQRRKTIPIPKKIRMTPMGLRRVNRRRKEMNLGLLDVQAIPVGHEVETVLPGELTVEEVKVMNSPVLKSEIAQSRSTGEAVFAPADLPAYVDNSTLKYFPPIADQGIASTTCAHFTSMYYQLTYMTSMVRNWDAKNGGDSYRFSPYFSFNQVERPFAWLYKAYDFAVKHGAATKQEFSGGLDAATWRHALDFRAMQWGRIPDIHTSAGLTKVKQYLVNGYVLGVSTYLHSWDYAPIKNDPATTADDPFVGTYACQMVDDKGYYHAMTIVGYHDDIWIDLNKNDEVDLGEKGAFRVVNSFGVNGYGLKVSPYYWVAYDAMQKESLVAGGPNHTLRRGVWERNEACWITARASYTPLVVAEITLNHSKVDQLRIRLGLGDTSATVPSETWLPSSVLRGGRGQATPISETFILDFTDLTPPPGQTKRWFVGVGDTTSGDPATLTSFKLINVSDGSTIVCSDVPKSADAEAFAWVDWAYSGTNSPPVIEASPFATPNPTLAGQVVVLSAAAVDSEQMRLSYNWTFGDGSSATGATVRHVYLKSGTYTAKVAVVDGKGGMASNSVTVIVNDNQTAPEFLTSLLDMEVNEGQSALFCSEVYGSAPLTYQWRKNGVNIVGAINASYTTPITTMADNGAMFSVFVSNAFGNATSNGFKLKVIKDGLLAHWKFDEPSGVLAEDATGNGHIGNINASSWITRGKVNGALALNAPVSLLPQRSWQPNNRVALSSAWTVSSWFTTPLPKTKDGWHDLTYWIDSDVFSEACNHISVSNTLELGIYSKGVGGGMRACGYNLSNLSSGWHHVTATGFGSTTKFYVDGNYVGTSDWNPNSSYVEYLGGRSSDQLFSNKIDDVRIYNRALSASEVAALVYATPTLTTQPRDVMVNVGQTETFQVVASGVSPLMYQWQKNGVDIPGATMASYLMPPANIDDNGAKFRVVVSNVSGRASSDEASLIVNTANGAPIIIAQPQNIKANIGHAVRFKVTAVGVTSLSYQWLKNDAIIFGATAASYTTSAAVSGDSGANFSVVVSNASGDVTSDGAVLTVSEAAPKITTQTSNVTVNVGESPSFSIVATGTGPLTYTWFNTLDALASNATGPVYTTSLTHAEQNGAYVYCTVSNSAGSVRSTEGVLTVLAPPRIKTQPANVLVDVALTATFSVVMADPAPFSHKLPHTQPWTYQWRKNGINIPGGTDGSYTTPPLDMGDNGMMFSVVVSNSVGSVTSNNATLMVKPGLIQNRPPVVDSPITADPDPGIAGEPVGFLVGATDADNNPLTFTWAFGDGETGSGSAPVHTYVEAGDYSVSVTITDGQGGSTNDSMVFTVSAIIQPPTEFTITVTSFAGGNISPQGTVTVTEGSAQSFTITEDNGYQIDDVIVDGVSLGAKTSHTFSNVTANHTIAATFSSIGGGGTPGLVRLVARNQHGVPVPTASIYIREKLKWYPVDTEIQLTVGTSYRVKGKTVDNPSGPERTIVVTGTMAEIEVPFWTAPTGARDQFGNEVTDAIIRIRYTDEEYYSPNTSITLPKGYKAAVFGKIGLLTGPLVYMTFTDGLHEIDPGFWTATVKCRDQFGAVVTDGVANVQYGLASGYSDGDVLTFAKGDQIKIKSKRNSLKANAYDSYTFTAGLDEIHAKFRTVAMRAVATNGITWVPSAEVEIYNSRISRFANGASITLPHDDTIRVRVFKEGSKIADVSNVVIDASTDTITIHTSYVASGTPVNQAPVAVPQALSLLEDNTLSVALTGTDAENDPLTFAKVSDPFNGSLSGTLPNLTYTPNANFNGTDSFTFKVNDGALDSNVATILLTIDAVNDAPVASFTTNTNSGIAPLTTTFSAAGSSDTDGNIDSYSWDFGDGGTATGSSPNHVYTMPGNYSARLTVTDNEGLENEASLTITVNDSTGIPGLVRLVARDQNGVSVPDASVYIREKLTWYPAGTEVQLSVGSSYRVSGKSIDSQKGPEQTIVITSTLAEIEVPFWTATVAARDQFGNEVSDAIIRIRYVGAQYFSSGTSLTLPKGYKAAVFGKVGHLTGPLKYMIFTDGLNEIDPGFWTTKVKCRDQFGAVVADGVAYVQYGIPSSYADGETLTFAKGDQIKIKSKRKSLKATAYDTYVFTDGLDEIQMKFRSVTYKGLASNGVTLVPGAEIEIYGFGIARFANGATQTVPYDDIIRVRVYKDGSRIGDVSNIAIDANTDEVSVTTSW